MHVCVHVQASVCVSVRVAVCTYSCAYLCVHLHRYWHTGTYACTGVGVHVCTSAYMRVYAHVGACGCVSCVCMCVGKCGCVHVCRCVCTHVCIHVSVCVNVRISTQSELIWEMLCDFLAVGRAAHGHPHADCAENTGLLPLLRLAVAMTGWYSPTLVSLDKGWST